MRRADVGDFLVSSLALLVSPPVLCQLVKSFDPSAFSRRAYEPCLRNQESNNNCAPTTRTGRAGWLDAQIIALLGAWV